MTLQVIKRPNHNVIENTIYLLIWFIVFSMLLIGHSNNGEQEPLFHAFIWIKFGKFFLLFLINNYILTPFLFLKKKYFFYTASVFAVLFLLMVLPFMAGWESSSPPPLMRMMQEQAEALFPLQDPPRRPGPGPAFNDCIIGILIIGFNLAIRFLFKSIRDERHIRELKSQSLQAELNYLKTQINPHFFMNTLNNIHALIDFDREKAKDTVIELSKIMRYILYEANMPRISLQKEILFLENYVNLMRIRFTDEIDIKMEYPDNTPECKIAPLLLVTLVENAFKHGISYRRDSFIHSRMEISDNMLTYTVENSLPDPELTKEQKPGVGLDNMHKRLRLIYGGKHWFVVNRNLEKYSVTLTIPLEND